MGQESRYFCLVQISQYNLVPNVAEMKEQTYTSREMRGLASLAYLRDHWKVQAS
jgi:hypothetical protein